MKLNLTTPVPASVLKARHFAYTVSFYLHSKLVGDLLLAPLCRQRNPRAREMERPVPSVTQEGGGGAVPHKQADNWCENPVSPPFCTRLAPNAKKNSTKEKGCHYIKLKK